MHYEIMNDKPGNSCLQIIFDQIQEALTVIEADEIVYANQRALHISGYAYSEYLQLSLWQLTAAQDHQRIRQVIQHIEQGADLPVELDITIITKDGEHRLIHNHISQLYEKNGVKTWLISSTDCGRQTISHDVAAGYSAVSSTPAFPILKESDEQARHTTANLLHDDVSINNSLTSDHALLQAMLDSNPDMLFIKDQQGRYIVVNQAMADFYDTTIDKITGKTDEDFHPLNIDDISLMMHEDRQVLEQKREFVIPEVNYVNAKGKAGCYRVVKRPILAEDGKACYVVGAITDISGRKRLEDALVREQKLFEGGPVIVFRRFTDEPRSIEYVSPNIAQFGYTVEDFTSGKYVLADIVHPDDWERANCEIRQYRESGKNYYEMEYRIICGDGSIRWVYDYTYVTRNENGEIQYFDWYILDITETKQVAEQNQRQLRRLAALRDIDISITSNLDLRKTLQVLLGQVAEQLGVDAASVLLYDKNSKTLTYTMNRGFRTSALRNTCLNLGEGNAGQAALQRKIVYIPDLAGEPNSLEHAAFIEKEGFVSYFGVPLVAKEQLKGVLEVFLRTRLEHDDDWTDFLRALAGQAAIAIDDAAMVKEIQEANINITLAYDATIEGWARALELRDMETEGHSQRVTDMTLVLSVAMGIKGDNLVHIRRGALLHDIGKMGISDSILLKPGPLSEIEKKLIRKHPVFGYEMIRPIDFLKPAIDIVLYHHEKWDGSGYPKGLAGKQIPLTARLFSIIDVWDAVSHDRPYHKAWEKEQVLQYIREQSGKHFDPEITETFLKILQNQKGI